MDKQKKKHTIPVAEEAAIIREVAEKLKNTALFPKKYEMAKEFARQYKESKPC